MTEERVLPWHQDILARWVRIAQSGRLPHALIITAPCFQERHHFSRILIQALCCQSSAGDQPCHGCKACHLFHVGNHPDVMTVSVEEGKKKILIDQIRAVREFAALSSHEGGRRVVWITSAESMNPEATNALLKTLEEPQGGLCLILEAARPNALAPTIRSRCQILNLTAPSLVVARDWLIQEGVEAADVDRCLALARGLPLVAKEMVSEGFSEHHQQCLSALESLTQNQSSLVGVADLWLKFDAKKSLQSMYFWICGLICRRLGADGDIYGGLAAEKLGKQVRDIPVASLFECLGKVQSTLRMLDGQADERLLVEGVLCDWMLMGHQEY